MSYLCFMYSQLFKQQMFSSFLYEGNIYFYWFETFKNHKTVKNPNLFDRESQNILKFEKILVLGESCCHSVYKHRRNLLLTQDKSH